LTKTSLIYSVSCFKLGGGLELCSPKPPRGDGIEQTVDKSWISCRSFYIFLQAFMKECSSCYYCSKVKALKLRYNELTMQLTTGLVIALSDSVNSNTANLTVNRCLRIR